MNKHEYNSGLEELSQADSDMQAENREKLVKREITPSQWLEQQAIIGRLFKAGMDKILSKVKEIADSPE